MCFSWIMEKQSVCRWICYAVMYQVTSHHGHRKLCIVLLMVFNHQRYGAVWYYSQSRARTCFGKSWKVLEINIFFQDLESFGNFLFMTSGQWKNFEFFVRGRPAITLKRSTVSVFQYHILNLFVSWIFIIFKLYFVFA